VRNSPDRYRPFSLCASPQILHDPAFQAFREAGRGYASEATDLGPSRDVDPELFFPVGTTGPAEAQVQSAKAICALCPVREECLQWALDTAQDAGVWGGLSEEERRALRRGQRRRVRIA
jgi:WhiB family redox-sensing transcriptional regulator